MNRLFAQATLPLALVAACGPATPGLTSPRAFSGAITENTKWTLAKNCPMVITENVVVGGSANPVLEIEAGCVVNFKKGTYLSVGAKAGEGGALKASGTLSNNIVFTSAEPTQAPGDWGGLQFLPDTADDATQLQYVTVAYAGSTGAHSGIFIESSKPTFKNLTVLSTKGTGIFLADESAAIAENSIAVVSKNNSQFGISATAQAGGSIPEQSSVYDSNTVGAAEIRGGTVKNSVSYGNINASYIVTNQIQVHGPSAPILSFDAGVTMAFDSSAGISAAYQTTEKGSIQTNGTADQRVTFTSAQATLKKGDWAGIAFYPSSVDADNRLLYTTVAYGGSDTNKANIYVEDAQIFIQNVIAQDSFGNGFNLYANAGFAPGSAGLGTMRSALAGVSIDANQVGSLPKDNPTFSDDVGAPIVVRPGQIATAATWENLGVPYVIDGEVSIHGASAPVLSLNPGVVLKFAAGGSLEVAYNTAENGALAAVGTAGNPVIFTGVLAQPGSWAGVYFYDATVDASSRLENVLIEYAGGSSDRAELVTDDATPTFVNVQVRNTPNVGFKCKSGYYKKGYSIVGDKSVGVAAVDRSSCKES